MDKHVHSI